MGPDRPADCPSDVEQVVHGELLAIRKHPEGLSSTSITAVDLVDLVGDGVPLIAMSRLTHRILETIELDDDATRITAASCSLGLGSNGRTHLQRMDDFGSDCGYETRRLSDEGLRELARLVASNRVVHAVPAVVVSVVRQADQSLAIRANTRRQWYIDMRLLIMETQDLSGERRPLEPEPVTAATEITGENDLRYLT